MEHRPDPAPGSPAALFREGIQLCRQGKWREGFDRLSRVAPKAERGGNLPGVYYSYLGVGMARVEGRRRDGLELCRYGVQTQPTEPDNHLNLARVYLMLGRRRAAITALETGLALNPRHPRLLEFHEEMGVRRPPVLRFLDRAHRINVLAGRVRHWLEERREAWQEQREAAAAARAAEREMADEE
jgi:hypothetical protein